MTAAPPLSASFMMVLSSSVEIGLSFIVILINYVSFLTYLFIWGKRDICDICDEGF